MSDYLREPKKVRTRSELIKSCRGLREHNEKLRKQLAAVTEEVERWHDGDSVSVDSMCRICEMLKVQ